MRVIRERVAKDHIALGILRPASNFDRYFAHWADHSTILNHGYLLLTVKVLYTSDIFFTNEEMKVMKGGKWNVQEIVERPSVCKHCEMSQQVKKIMKTMTCSLVQPIQLRRSRRSNYCRLCEC